ncbi:STAS/SEC14 domain-containing protein (plasmid) [Sulfitobacter sp. SK012]|uniref:STAS/SEC14 domain-containing protein n=1 Tax=Sulfitobacter sp. SK012 TaxID=1389005 RepID=UPI000E0C5599|nr:STAS/SEC14 domain-containing protein [Sulfitobacter sp. SK012]AXI49089.1 STAS/SEC14 domain-containing protein [Sulfitobacter sp. SK012]
MIAVKSGAQESLLEVYMSAPITDKDYSDVLMPALDAALAQGEKVRMLVVLNAGLTDFTMGALWDDAKLGVSNWSGFERVAIVTANTAMARMVRAFSILMPCPVSVFGKKAEDEARLWLFESLGAIHQTDLGSGTLHVELLGKVGADVYASETENLNAFIRKNDRFRLLLDIRRFDGWQGLGAMAAHFHLVRDHVGQLDRAAVVGDSRWEAMVVQVVKRLIGQEARYFGNNDLEAAKAWIKTD